MGGHLLRDVGLCCHRAGSQHRVLSGKTVPLYLTVCDEASASRNAGGCRRSSTLGSEVLHVFRRERSWFAGEAVDGRTQAWVRSEGREVERRGCWTAPREPLMGDPEGPVQRFRKVLEGLKEVFGPSAPNSGSRGGFGLRVKPPPVRSQEAGSDSHRPAAQGSGDRASGGR